jgi:hypothetical protein
MKPLIALLPWALLTSGAIAAEPAAGGVWLPPSRPEVQISDAGPGAWKIRSGQPGDFTLESARRYAAAPGESFEIRVRIKVDLATWARPDLVCYDAAGREIEASRAIKSAPSSTTTDWQSFRLVFPVLPGAASVGARIRASGRGEIVVADLEVERTKIDPYQTGALVSQPHPRTRTGVVIESNLNIVNTELLSDQDRDGDGRWAVISIDLDRLTRRESKGVDWRTNFEDNPNEIFWSDGAVLKSDTVWQDRRPDVKRALHFRTRLHQGPYRALMSDPGRSVAVSLDGKTWRRCEGGGEIELGVFAAGDGLVEFWVDACYRDPVSAGPVYFDYVRFLPTLGTPSVERLYQAARQKPRRLERGSREEKTVEIGVRAPRFALGDHWPVRCGLPVPQGELADAQHAAVVNAEGVPVTSQNRVMATWPDGSVKWLFLDFLHDFSGNGEGRYRVAYGNRVHAAPPPAAVQLRPTAQGLEVDTGAIRFLVPKKRFGILEAVRRSGGGMLQEQPIAAEIVETGGRIWRALDLPVEKIEVEQPGPLHAVIRSETRLARSGRPAEGFYHRVRIHAYAGSPLVQIDYFVANTDSRPAKDVGGSMASKVAVKSIALKLRPARPITAAVCPELPAGGAGVDGAVVQKDEETILTNSGGELRQSAGHARGWLSLGLEGNGLLGAGVADFRAQYPKALRWNARGLEIALWAEEGGDYEWIEGVGKTHHLALFYGAAAPQNAGSPGGNPPDAALLAEGPVLALAAPEWYTRSGVFGPQITAAQSGFPAVEKTLANHIADPVVKHIGLGFENYGDHSSNGYVQGTYLWDNNEYDLPAGAIVHFVRSGDREALRAGLAGALHYLDVDTIHYSSEHGNWAAAQHVHSHSTFGHHTAQKPDMQHAGYVQGLIWYSYFTGEPIGLLGAQGIADWVLKNIGVQTTAMERIIGHPLMTLNDVYEATWDDKYLRGAAQLVDETLKWENPVRSGFLAPIFESPAYYSGSPFCGGLLPSALLKFNGFARLPEIDAMLARVGQWTLTDVWTPPADIYSKGGSPRKGHTPADIASHLRLMSHLFARTGDPMFLVVPEMSLVAGYGENPRSIGTRSTGLVFNYLPWFLAALKENGNPQPEPLLEVRCRPEEVIVGKGGSVQVRFTLRNTGPSAVDELRASFHSRLDFQVTAETVVPVAADGPRDLPPGGAMELVYTIRAPQRINLTCQYNSVAYGHFSLLYRRAGKAHYAHHAVKISMK